MNLLAFLARLLGALVSLIVDMRRVKCDFHVPSLMTTPAYCEKCWVKIP